MTVVSRRVDKKYGTHYAANVEAYRKYLQKNDLAFAMGLTDVKGDRSLRPAQQKQHKDFYVRIVEERSDGIIVSGAKTHISQAPACNEVLIAPCRAMQEDDSAYAVAFGIPLNAPGITMICAQREIGEDANLFDHPISKAVYINDATIVFDNVFIPNERVFLCGETKATRDLVHRFSDFQRFASATCRSGYIDLCIGAGMALADYNGAAGFGHIRDTLVDMSVDSETLYGLVAGSAALATELPSGVFLPETFSVNAAKLYMNEAILKAGQRLAEIGGGILVTRPSSVDLEIPGIGELLAKYHQGRAGVAVEDRLKMARLCESLSGLAALTPILSVIAAGPPATRPPRCASAISSFRRQSPIARESWRNDSPLHTTAASTGPGPSILISPNSTWRRVFTITGVCWIMTPPF